MTTLAVATWLAALVSPLFLRYVPFTGLTMTAASFLTAVLIAVVAGLVTGSLHPDATTLAAILSGSTGFWTVQQMVYQALSKTPAAALVKDEPPTPAPKAS